MKCLGNCYETINVIESLETIIDYVHRTPLKQSQTINSITGSDVFLKMENMQKTGSFKLRGALNKVLHLSELEAAKGIIAASAGNHAQGVAYAAYKRGIRAKIYMPVHTPESKVNATKTYGAEIILTGETFQEAYEAAELEQRERAATFVHPFDDPLVMAGQGTAALEMMQQTSGLDAILVPVGGGGLIAGTAAAVKQFSPSTKVIGVQTAAVPALYNRFKGKPDRSYKSAESIAEGILVKQPGRLTYPVIKQLVDEMVTVTEAEIAYAMVLMLERQKTFVEGAGAAALAALLCKRLGLENKRVGVMISGGNADMVKFPMLKSMAEKAEPRREIS